MSHTKRQFILLAIVVNVIFPWSTEAANSPTSEPLTTESVRVSGEIGEETVERAVVVATTDIYNAKIVAQNGHEVTVLFDLYNAKGVQSGVIYGIEIYTNDSTGRKLVDAVVYREKTLTLGEGETLPVAVNYSAPTFLSGTHEVWIMAKTKSGMPLSLALAGKVDLIGAGEQIKLTDCATVVAGEQFALTAGVDMTPSESLSVTCVAESTFAEPIEVTPQFMNYERSIYGAIVEASLPTAQSEMLAPGKKTEVTFVVPVAQKAQAYDAVMELVADIGEVVSSPVVIHYVIQGESATLQNVVFDKAVYRSGETAEAMVIWSLAADTFTGARGAGTAVGPLTLSVVMADGTGAFCSSPSVLSLQTAGIASQLAVPVTRDCVNPQLVLSLANEAGTAIAKQSYNYTPVAASEQLEAPLTIVTYLQVVGSLIALILVLLFVAVKLLSYARVRVPAPVHLYEPTNTTQKTSATLIGLVVAIILGGSFFGATATSTMAATLNVTSGFDTVTFTVNTNKATYEVDESVQVFGAAFVTGCGNSITDGGLEAVDGQGVTQSIGVFNMDPYNNPGGFAMFDKYVDGYSLPGAKLMPVRAYVTVSNVLNSALGNLPLNVVCPDDSTWDGVQCVSNNPVPVGTISGSGCTIGVDDSTCVATITWNSQHVTSPTVRNVTTNTIYSYDANGNNEQRTITGGVNVIAVYDQATLLDSEPLVGTCEVGSSWNGLICEAAAQPSATISATSCEISEGDSSCVVALTWHIQSATTPNVRDATTGTPLSANSVGVAVPNTIAYGSHNMQARDGMTVLDSAMAIASCVGGTIWDNTKCVTDPIVGGGVTVSLTANGDDSTTNITVGDDVHLSWVVTGNPDQCVATDDWNGTKAVTGGAEWVMNVAADSTFTIVCTGVNGSASDSVVVQAKTRSNLVPVGLSLSPSAVFDPTTGIYDSLFVQYSVQNTGGTDAGAFVDRLKLDRDANGSYEDSIDVPVVAGLAAGADTPLQPRLLAINVPFGTHRILLKTDVFDTVTEGNEGDNEKTLVLSVPVPDPGIELVASPTLIRSGGTITVSWNTHTTFPMNCEVRGPKVSHDFDPSVVGAVDSRTVSGLIAKSEYRIQCTEPSTGTVFTDNAWIEVLPTIQEI
jgi:hypothetical protein